ncbi:DUF1559 domain-containing protein [bacterium]|nr:DUF1559 domain-containing protein [bacterium]
MNEFGLSLLWLMLQISVLCLVALPVYLLARRNHPRTGAIATLATLLLVTLVTISAVSPWPRWSISDSPWRESVTRAVTPAVASTENAPGSGVEDETATVAVDVSTATRLVEAAGELWQKLGQPSEQSSAATSVARSPEATRLGWTGCLAWLFVAGLVVAICRLLLGLLAVRSHRRTSTAVVDPEILAEVDVLRAEFRCQTPIDVRRSEAITSAATVGWKRPLILLPPEHVGWSASERRSVLAHEIAHICSNDFLCWVCAQTGLLLHFYHPLVHWLARRLRLEQELAADAAAARFSGGAEPYLQTLAALALRQADRPVAWPARTFLPVKGTLMRRVEMLRETRVARAVPSGWRHGVVITLLLAASLVLCGIKPPESRQVLADDQSHDATPATFQAESPADGQPTAAEVAGQAADETLIAQADEKKSRRERRLARKAAADAGSSVDGAFDLKYVPSSTNLLMGIRPSSLVAEESLAPLIAGLEQNVLKSENGPDLKIADLKQVLLLGLPEGEINSLGRDPFFVLTPADGAQQRVRQWAAMWFAEDGGEYRKHSGGYVYFALPSGKCFVELEGGTIGIGRREVAMTSFLDANANAQTSPGWAEDFHAVEQNQMCLAVRVSAVRPELDRVLNRGGNQPPNPAAAFSPLWQQTQLLVGGSSIGKSGRFELIAHCLDEAGAKQVAETVQSLVPLGRNMVAGFQRQMANRPAPTPPGPTPQENLQETMNKGFTIASQFLDSVEVTQKGDTVHVTAHVTADTGAGSLPIMAALLLPAVQNARTAAQRSQSTNNLKQIALALHNYHDTYGHFPAPSVLGPDGKTTHSWRVAILPFIEQEPLFRQYHQDEPWDSENNLKVLKQMPVVFRHPSEPDGTTTSSYFALVGPTTALGEGGEGTRIREITDGTSNTLLIVEARREIPWTKPVDIPYAADQPLPKFGGLNPGVWLGALADGSVRTFAATIDEKIVRAMITRNGREPVTP